MYVSFLYPIGVQLSDLFQDDLSYDKVEMSKHFINTKQLPKITFFVFF